MSRKLLVALAILVVLAVTGFVAMRLLMTPPDGLDLARSKATEAGLYIVAVAAEDGEPRQGPLHAWIATVTDAAGAPVEDALIDIDGGMPQHGHGLPTAPQAGDHLGDGRYRIEGVRFNMGGWWELRLTVRAAAGQDAVTFNIVL